MFVSYPQGNSDSHWSIGCDNPAYPNYGTSNHHLCEG